MTSVTRTFTPQQILALPIDSPDLTEATNVGQYLMSVLGTYYAQNWSFNPGAPLGSEGWKIPIRDAFRKAGIIHKDEYDTDPAITKAFELLRNADWSTLQEYKEPEDWYVVLLEVDPYGDVVLDDSTNEGYTEKEAKRVAEECNNDSGGNGYIAVRIPK